MKDYYAFREALKQFESKGDYKAVNRFGYLGAYQFGKARLLDLGISIDNYGKTTRPKLYADAKKITKEQFLNDKQLQDEIFFKHIKDCLITIRSKYKQYLGKTYRGILITESGLAAGMHLVGKGGIARWFKGEDVKDGNGVKAEQYIKRFAGYNLEKY